MKPGRFARRGVRRLDAYDEAPGEGLNLMNNTSLFGANPALDRVLRGARAADLVDYPSLAGDDLRSAAARNLGVAPEQVTTGNGSNELIDLIIRTFAEPGESVAYHPPSFSMIPIFVQAHGALATPVPLGDAWALDADAVVAAQPKVAIICRPNNPTGNAFPREDVLRVVEGVDGVVVVDEAYVEFGPGSLADGLPDHPNMVVLRTLSKAHGLAGIRAGYAASHPDVARELSKVRGPFRLNTLSERAAAAALDDTTYVDAAVKAVREERERVGRALAHRGFTVHPSDANFVLVEPPVNAQALARALAARGVLVRDFNGDLAPYIRFTVGPRDAMDRFLDAVDGALAEVAG